MADQKAKLYDVMISYSQQADVQIIFKITDTLEQRGWKVAIDRAKIRSVLAELPDSVARSSCVVVFMSSQYEDSRQCRCESSFAFRNNIPVIPVRTSKLYAPNGWLDMLIGDRLYVDFDTFEFNEAFDMLERQIRHATGIAQGNTQRGNAEQIEETVQPAIDVSLPTIKISQMNVAESIEFATGSTLRGSDDKPIMLHGLLGGRFEHGEYKVFAADVQNRAVRRLSAPPGAPMRMETEFQDEHLPYFSSMCLLKKSGDKLLAVTSGRELVLIINLQTRKIKQRIVIEGGAQRTDVSSIGETTDGTILVTFCRSFSVMEIAPREAPGGKGFPEYFLRRKLPFEQRIAFFNYNRHFDKLAMTFMGGDGAVFDRDCREFRAFSLRPGAAKLAQVLILDNGLVLANCIKQSIVYLFDLYGREITKLSLQSEGDNIYSWCQFVPSHIVSLQESDEPQRVSLFCWTWDLICKKTVLELR